MIADKEKNSCIFLLCFICIVVGFFISYYFIVSNSSFFSDDLTHMRDAVGLGFWEYIFLPIDVHFAPLHKLLTYFLYKTAPFNFSVALIVMLTIHAATVFFLYKLIRFFCPSALSIILVFLYSCSQFIVEPLFWWSSGAHRFPYVLLSVITVYLYARHCFFSERYSAFFSWVCFVLAFGFYSKAVLIPFYVLAIEFSVCLFRRESLLSKRIFIIGSFFFTSLLYVLWYRYFSSVIKFDTDFNFLVFHRVLLDFILVFFSANLLFVGKANAYILVIAFLIVCFFVSRDRRSLLVFTMFFLCVVINFSIIASSSRAMMFGGWLANSLRYSFDFYFLVILCLGICLGLLGEYKSLSNSKFIFVMFICSVMYSVLGGMKSIDRAEGYKEAYNFARSFFNNLGRGISAISEGKILIAEGLIPEKIFGGFGSRITFGEIIPLMDSRVEIVFVDEAVYLVDESGLIKRI